MIVSQIQSMYMSISVDTQSIGSLNDMIIKTISYKYFQVFLYEEMWPSPSL